MVDISICITCTQETQIVIIVTIMAMNPIKEITIWLQFLFDS